MGNVQHVEKEERRVSGGRQQRSTELAVVAAKSNTSSTTRVARGSSQSTTQGLVGLKNLGNTCFLNSALQCLSNTGPLVDFFLNEEWKLQLNRENVLSCHGEVAEAFGDLMLQMWLLLPDELRENSVTVSRKVRKGLFSGCCGSVSNVCEASISTGTGTDIGAGTANPATDTSRYGRRTSSKPYISPKKFKTVLDRHCEIFAGYNQHDSQELLMFLLDALHEDLNRIMRKPYVEDVDYDGECISYESDVKAKDPNGRIPRPMPEFKVAELSWIGHLQRNQSVIVDLLQGQLRSVLQCSKCQFKSVKFEPFMNLELPLIQNEQSRKGRRRQYVDTNISSCLREFCKVENLTGDHQWRCPKCKKLRDATKQLTLYNLPNVLIITFKRFQVDIYGRSGGKIDTAVDFPLQGFDVSDGMSRDSENKLSIPSDTDDNDPKYDLYAVSNHFGGMGGGHYTAFALNKMDQHWYQYDDSSVTRKKPSDICTSNAYVLFFRKKKMQTKLGSMLEESPVKIAKDGSKRKGSVHVRQRQSVKERLESWPIKQIASPDPRLIVTKDFPDVMEGDENESITVRGEVDTSTSKVMSMGTLDSSIVLEDESPCPSEPPSSPFVAQTVLEEYLDSSLEEEGFYRA